MGACYTGLWTALALTKMRPDMRVLIVEKEVAGFGASGRNGGWVSALFPTGAQSLINRHGVAPRSSTAQSHGGRRGVSGEMGE